MGTERNQAQRSVCLIHEILEAELLYWEQVTDCPKSGEMDLTREGSALEEWECSGTLFGEHISKNSSKCA